ncbi:MAG: hypothetical protein PVF73_11485 [Bacteroidales bacterium]|jgi:hypothetical protein
MKQKAFVTGLFLFASLLLFGQECSFYYPRMEGTELVYQHYYKKGDPSGSSSHRVTHYKEFPGGAEATILFRTFDKKGKPVSESTLEVKCESGTFYFDMRGYINQQMVSAYEDMEVKVETDNLELPGNISPGDVLKDGSVTMDVSSSGLKIMSMKTSVTDRKVEAKESVTTKAGTFDCYRISSVVTTASPVKIVMETMEWFSPGTGMIKSESYSRSKLAGRSELTELNKGI